MAKIDVKTLSNKQLKDTINKIRKEKANPEIYGRGGTSRWVSSSEFWSGYHSKLKKELARRKKKGLIGKSAGISKLKRRIVTGFKMPKTLTIKDLMRM